jgi:hypothetical protein
VGQFEGRGGGVDCVYVLKMYYDSFVKTSPSQTITTTFSTM